MHTITIDDNGGEKANNYKIIFDGNKKPEKIEKYGASANPNDTIYQKDNGTYVVQGQANGGRDGYRYSGARVRQVFEFPERVRFKIDDLDWMPTSDFDVTQRDDWPGESSGNSGDNGGGIELPDLSLEDGQTYKLTNVNSGKVLDVSEAETESGTDIQQWEWDNKPQQKWTAKQTNDGHWKLWANHTDKVAEINPDEPENGGGIRIWGSHGGGNQRWKVDSVGGNAFKLTSVNSGKVMDVKSVSNENGATVHQWEYVGGDNQKWKFEEVDTGKTSVPSRPEEDPRERCDRVGIDINETKHVNAVSDIDLKRGVCYVVSGTLEYDQPLVGNGVDHTAVVGTNNAKLSIPENNRSYDINVDGRHFLWANIDLDQQANGAWGRWWMGGERMIVEDVKTIGRGRRANPDPTSPVGGKSGPAMYMPARGDGAVNVIRRVENVHGGVMADHHFGDRPSGVWMGPQHKGTLRILDSEISEFPNNAIYASVCSGSVEAENSRFANNGVTNGRISHGHFRDCEVIIDHENSGLGNPNPNDHATIGLAAEQKKGGVTGGDPPDIHNCSIELKDVSKTRGAASTYNIFKAGRFGTIADTDFHVERGAGRSTAHLYISGICERIVRCNFTGDADRGACIVNQGPSIQVNDNTFNTPNSRKNFEGPNH